MRTSKGVRGILIDPLVIFFAFGMVAGKTHKSAMGWPHPVSTGFPCLCVDRVLPFVCVRRAVKNENLPFA